MRTRIGTVGKCVSRYRTEGQARLKRPGPFVWVRRSGNGPGNTLVRAGVGFVRWMTRDFVETSNLQRQVLFDEVDAKQGVPNRSPVRKNSTRSTPWSPIEPVVAHIDGGTSWNWPAMST